MTSWSKKRYERLKQEDKPVKALVKEFKRMKQATDPSKQTDKEIDDVWKDSMDGYWKKFR